MAVEKQRVIGRLRALFPKANLTKERLNAIAERLAKKPADDADDAAIDVVINEFNDNSFLGIEDIAREDDRLRTLEAQVKNQNPNPSTAPSANPEPNPTPAPAPSPDDTPAWAKALIQANEKMSLEMEALKTGRIIESKKQTAQKQFESSEVLKGLKPEVKERWLSRIDVNSEVSIEDQVEGLETEYKELVQTSAETSSYAGPLPTNGNGNVGKFSAEDAEKIVNEIGI